jgi:hypothetical protein
MRAVPGLVGLAAVAALLGGCKGDATAPLGGSVSTVLSAVTLEGSGTNAALVDGTIPEPAGGPALSLSAPLAAINGGSSAVGLSTSTEFQTVVVGVQGQPDFYEVNLPAPATSARVLVTVAQDVSLGTIQLVLAVGGSRSTLGPYATQSLSLITVGTGDVQVSISWNSAADVDLHVVEPGGEEVYYGHTASATGGELDLDSNAACGSDGPRNENITWASGTAPAGEYIVRVDYWSACAATQTDYVVTVHVQGHEPEIFSGTFTGAGDNGGEGSGVEVTRFTK